ncbi:DNA polymerase Y family protein [Piscinibacter sp. HJYY11]|uniref:Y-family DNA polymerase n=1 Tax=Piscinibacter sp. HJYY11 TaxID=2801333 RepID=UPI00191CA5B5|nr:DNA polymerase Y family protein [Piscinibacter sp. HJYY11]MBL0726159.1 DNA polymerase Y family protein [Piscinibacter sp. HJYY11]
MLWAALLLPSAPDAESPPIDAVRGLSLWCLQFTPRVAIVEESAVVMELKASVRLFGGGKALRARVEEEAKDLGVTQVSWAPTSLAAVAFARAGVPNGFREPLDRLLDRLPMSCLVGVTRHEATLSRIGCRTLGDVRKLPRGGLSRRFDKELLCQLDQAYGLLPEAHERVVMPETFRSRLELPSRIEHAPAILFGARRLLMQLCGWLTARHAGVTTCTLKWCHDVMRSKTAGDGGELTIRTAEPMRDLEHLSRLLAEHLAKVELKAPVGDLELLADDVIPLEERSASLIPDPRAGDESLTLVLERIAARLGADKVLRPVTGEDHRPEWSVHWQPAPLPHPRQLARQDELPQPNFLLDKPLRLDTHENRPRFQGPLQLITGPHRVEGGWWHRVSAEEGATALNVQRDYWVANSAYAGTLWIYQERLADDQTAWYLQGRFA